MSCPCRRASGLTKLPRNTLRTRRKVLCSVSLRYAGGLIRSVLAGGSLGWMVRGSMVVRSFTPLLRDRNIRRSTGTVPGCSLCVRTLYGRQTYHVVAREDQLWLPHHHGRRTPIARRRTRLIGIHGRWLLATYGEIHGICVRYIAVAMIYEKMRVR